MTRGVGARFNLSASGERIKLKLGDHDCARSVSIEAKCDGEWTFVEVANYDFGVKPTTVIYLTPDEASRIAIALARAAEDALSLGEASDALGKACSGIVRDMRAGGAFGGASDEEPQ